MIPKWEDVQLWLNKADIPERWHKWIARVAFGIVIVILLSTILGSMKGILGPKVVSDYSAPTVPSNPIEDAHRTFSYSSKNNQPCGNSGDFNPQDDTHQREAWNLLEKTLAEMQQEKREDSINMRLIEEARLDWDKDHTGEALSKFRAALGCNLLLKNLDARE